MSIKQQIKFKDSIDFEQDQQDAMSRTENIQSLADQVERLEGLNKRIETSEQNLKSPSRDAPIIFILGLPACVPETSCIT